MLCCRQNDPDDCSSTYTSRESSLSSYEGDANGSMSYTLDDSTSEKQFPGGEDNRTYLRTEKPSLRTRSRKHYLEVMIIQRYLEGEFPLETIREVTEPDSGSSQTSISSSEGEEQEHFSS